MLLSIEVFISIGVILYLLRLIFDLYRLDLDGSESKRCMKNTIFYNELVVNAIEKYHAQKSGGFSLLGDDKFESKLNSYVKDAVTQKSFDMQTKLYYLKLQHGEREFNSELCCCRSEAQALKASYESYSATKKVYTLEIEEWISVHSIESVSFEDVLDDEDFFTSFKNSFYKITPYTLGDIKKASNRAKLIWSMDASEHYHILKMGSAFILPSESEKSMPFTLSGGHTVMIDENGKFGLIHTGDSFKEQLDYREILAFKYHYISLDKFGYAEIQKYKIENIKDYKDLVCEILELSSLKTVSTKALKNSLSMGTFISVDKDRLLQFHTKNNEKISAKYTQIMMAYSLQPVQDTQTLLWGYIDKNAEEVIACQFEDWNFFNDGVCVLEEQGGTIVIDERGERIFESPYEKTIHYKERIFFVKEKDKWAVLKDGEIYVPFREIKEDFRDTLIDAIAEVKSKFLHKRYELPLVEYVKLFDTFRDRRDLVDAGLWGHPVNVKNGESGYVGWEYPASSSLYDLSIELPVDGFGQRVETLELVKGVK